MSKKIDSKPFYYVFGLFFVIIGSFLSWGTQNAIFYVLSVLGLGLIGVSTFKKQESVSLIDSTKRKKNLIFGIIILILSFVIIWITFENRFNLETMAKTKSI